MNDMKGRFYNCVAQSLAFRQRKFAARSQLKWTRDAWSLTKIIQACGARSNLMVVATLPTCLGPRTPFWHRPQGSLPTKLQIPPQNQQNKRCREQKSTPIRLNASGVHC